MTGKNPVVVAFVGMGSNTGPRLEMLRAAVAAMRATPEMVVEAISPVYQTGAHLLPGQMPQPDHLNAVAQLRTTKSPDALLAELRWIEREAGRDPRAARWAPRVLDLDLILYGDRKISTEALTVPHPLLAGRRFVLQPLADLARDIVVPGAGGATVSDLLVRCPDDAAVERIAQSLAG